MGEQSKSNVVMLKTWVIFDERAWFDDTDDCQVYEAFGEPEDTLESVKKDRDERWPGAPIFEYDVNPENNHLINQRMIG